MEIKLRYIIIGVFVFLFVSYIVLIADSELSTVRVRNKDLIINQKNPKITNMDVDVNLGSSKISSSNEKVSLKLKNSPIDTGNIKISSESNIKEQIANFDNENINYNAGGIDGTEKRLKNIAQAIKNNKYEEQRQEIEQQKRYKYSNVSWNTWKSNFINKFLEDSVSIKSLDNYGIGSWFYYSFEVTKYGEVKNINVKSMYLSDYDKMLVKNLIKSYSHKPITTFPTGSRREVVKVDAIVLLGDSESKTKPSDFHDFEKIKTEF